MTEISTYIRQPATGVWAVLMAATALSWIVGTDHDILFDNKEIATITVLLLAFAKVQLVGLHFMELREAPRALTLLFSAWVVLACAMISGIYLCR